MKHEVNMVYSSPLMLAQIARLKRCETLSMRDIEERASARPANVKVGAQFIELTGDELEQLDIADVTVRVELHAKPIKLDAEQPRDLYCYRRLFSTRGDELAHFQAQWLDDIGEPGFDPTRAERRIGRVYLMPGGIAVEHAEGRWTAYETRARAEQREHVARWAAFARGSWTRRCPDVPGLYVVARRDAAVPAQDLIGVYADFEFRRFAAVEGVVRDVTTHCPSHLRTEWRGFFWSEPLPSMLTPVHAGE